MSNNWNLETVKKWVETNTNMQLLSGDYKYLKKLKLIDKEGYLYESTFQNLFAGKTPNKYIKFNKYTLFNIKHYLSTLGFELVGGEYKNNRSVFTIKCDKGHLFKKDWMAFQQCPTCNVCNPSLKRSHKQFLEEVKSQVGEEYTVMSKYVNRMTKVTMRHNKCGNVWDVEPNSFINMRTRCPNNECCRLYGEDNPKYNANLTDEDRLVNRDVNANIIWRRSIFEKYNYTCVICGEDTKDNVAHHLNSYNWDIENRFNIENGVCLCSTHHKEFHSIFGYGDNTKQQFEEFKHSKKIIMSRATESQSK